MTAAERVEQRSVPEPNTGCRLWTGATTCGYGHLVVGGRAGKTVRAHRIIYEAAHGPIPAGMVVRHRCDTPACVELSHLELGGPADNSRDMVRRGRSARGVRHGSRTKPERITRGAQKGNAKLSDDAVREIRRLRADGVALAAVAQTFGVAKSIISRVANRRIWSHV